MAQDRTIEGMKALAAAVNEAHRKQVKAWTRFARAMNEAVNKPR